MNEVWKKPPVSLEVYLGMVGKEIGVSSWQLIDQNRINVFADVIEDHQFIHVDPERAKRETAFGTTIAHGFLTMSLLSIMSYEVIPVIQGAEMGVNYGFDKLRFISPVHAGRSQAAETEGAAVAYQCHHRDRGRGKASAGRRLDRPDLFRLGFGPHGRGLTRPSIAAQKHSILMDARGQARA